MLLAFRTALSCIILSGIFLQADALIFSHGKYLPLIRKETSNVLKTAPSKTRDLKNLKFNKSKMKQNNKVSHQPNARMKETFKSTILFIMLVFAFYSKTFAQDNTFGLSKNELTEVIQKCIDLPELQKYYPSDSDGSLKQLNILKYPLLIPSELALTKGGKPVNFIPQSTIAGVNVQAYSRYRAIENTGNTLKVNFNYFYKDGSQSEKTLFILIEFQKSGSNWNIINSSIKGDTL